MLRITESASVNAAQQYFERSLTRGDYYLEGMEVAGHWGGRAGEKLHLAGKVDQKSFEQLLENKRPDGTQLTARTIENRRPGYDFTFDVPKSVSLVHAFTGDERIPAAMRKAALETMRDAEQEMRARVRKNGAFEERKTGNMIWADFTHTTSRPAPLDQVTEKKLLERLPWLEKQKDKNGHVFIPDPHLHLHVYALNATFDPVESQWKAGDFMRIKRDAVYYQAAYHVRLAGELQKLGYRITPTAKSFELAGISRNLVELFSRRTKEVEEAAAALGIKDAKSKDALGARTRHGKNASLGLKQLSDIWASFLSAEQIAEINDVALKAKASQSLQIINSPEAAKRSIAFAFGRDLERVSEVSERKLLGTALENGVGQVTIQGVKDALAAFPGVLDACLDSDLHLTTVPILQEESKLLDIVRRNRGQLAPLISSPYEFKDPLFREDNQGTEEQRAAIKHVLESPDWIVGVVGRAGTGKTTLLKEIALGVKESGRDLVICAPTAEASRGVLRGEGFENAETAQRLLLDSSLHRKIRGNVLWIDEAGMLGNRDTLALLELAQKCGAARIVLAGDPTQIRSVPRGDAFRLLEEEAGLSIARLESIKRQKNPHLKQAVEAISRGNMDKGLSLLDQQKAILEADSTSAHKALAKEYVEQTITPKRHGKERRVLVVSPTHKEGDAITNEIRTRLKQTRRLSEEERAFPRTVNLSWTNAEKGNEACYQPGLIVQFKQHTPGFRKSERVRVIAARPGQGIVDVRKNDGTQAQLPLKEAKRFQVYQESELRVAPGDRLRITENGYAKDKKHRLNNGSFVRVSGFTPEGDMVIEGNGKIIPKQYGHLAHGYVVTADASQSKTVDTVLASVNRESMTATDMRRMYVTISRAKDEAKIYTDDKAELFRAAHRDNVRRSATELIGRERSQKIMASIPQRESQRRIEALRSPRTEAPRKAPSHQSTEQRKESVHVR